MQKKKSYDKVEWWNVAGYGKENKCIPLWKTFRKTLRHNLKYVFFFNQSSFLSRSF